MKKLLSLSLILTSCMQFTSDSPYKLKDSPYKPKSNRVSKCERNKLFIEEEGRALLNEKKAAREALALKVADAKRQKAAARNSLSPKNDVPTPTKKIIPGSAEYYRLQDFRN